MWWQTRQGGVGDEANLGATGPLPDLGHHATLNATTSLLAPPPTLVSPFVIFNVNHQ